MTTNDKEKRKEWDRKYRENHKDEVKKSDKKWRESEKGKKSKKKWRDNNPEKILERNRRYVEKNRDKDREKGRRYYYTSKGTACMMRKHDAKRLGINNTGFTYKIVELINDRDKECVYCGREFNKNINYDHINPFRGCSKNNIVKSCVDCNKDKSRANMIEWMNFKDYKISEKLQELYKKAYS